MENPTVTPSVTMQLGGEAHELRLGLRALKALGINPFQPGSVQEYLDSLDIDKAAAIVRACLLHQYAKGKARQGQEPPSVDEVIDYLDMGLFEGVLGDIIKASGLAGESDAPSTDTPDPQRA